MSEISLKDQTLRPIAGSRAMFGAVMSNHATPAYVRLPRKLVIECAVELARFQVPFCDIVGLKLNDIIPLQGPTRRVDLRLVALKGPRIADLVPIDDRGKVSLRIVRMAEEVGLGAGRAGLVHRVKPMEPEASESTDEHGLGGPTSRLHTLGERGTGHGRELVGPSPNQGMSEETPMDTADSLAPGRKETSPPTGPAGIRTSAPEEPSEGAHRPTPSVPTVAARAHEPISARRSPVAETRSRGFGEQPLLGTVPPSMPAPSAPTLRSPLPTPTARRDEQRKDAGPQAEEPRRAPAQRPPVAPQARTEAPAPARAAAPTSPLPQPAAILSVANRFFSGTVDGDDVPAVLARELGPGWELRLVLEGQGESAYRLALPGADMAQVCAILACPTGSERGWFVPVTSDGRAALGCVEPDRGRGSVAPGARLTGLDAAPQLGLTGRGELEVLKMGRGSYRSR